MSMEGVSLEEEEDWGTTDESDETDDSDEDPTFEALEEEDWGMDDEFKSETDDSDEDSDEGSDEDLIIESANRTPSQLLRTSLGRSRPRASKEIKFASDDMLLELEDGENSQLNDEEERCFERVEKMIRCGKLDQLKIDECKIYLRKYALRLTGNKEILQARINEHLEIMDGGGEKKYPMSTFVLNCKGDACIGDVVMFKQKIYDMFSIVSRSATGPPCGTRTIAGRIVNESYGAAKQQHTFTIEVLWSKGKKPLPPLHPLLIKGRNLYRLKTMRQRWDDEEEREKVLKEKHRRGFIARCSRESRIRKKEMKKVARGKCVKEDKSSKILPKKRRFAQLNQVGPDVLKIQRTWHHVDHPKNRSHPNDTIQIQRVPVEFKKSMMSSKHGDSFFQATKVQSYGSPSWNTRHQALTSEKPIAAGAQNTMHQALIPGKPIAAEGDEHDIHHQKLYKHSDRTQYRGAKSSYRKSTRGSGYRDQRRCAQGKRKPRRQ